VPRVYFVTHPEVAIDPARPVTVWVLSPRSRDQPSQGHYFCFEAGSRALLHGWRPLEQAL